MNRLQTLTPPTAFSATGSFGFSYDPLSLRTQMTRPNNVATNYAYDNLSRLQSVLHQLAGSTIDGAAYTVDNAGNRTAKTDQRTVVTSNYGYDAIYELTGVTQGTNTTESYTYDPVGNRLSSLGVSPYNVNVSNELTSTPSTSYTYDNNGNTQTKVVASNTTSFTWDFENRLSSVTLPGSGGTVSFKYDPFGRRIYKSSSTTTSVFAYDGENLVEEASASGAAVARYSQTNEVDEPLAMLRSSATSYYEADGLGSITSLSNAAGSLAQTYAFDSFGKQTASSGSLTNPFQYTGRELDSETGLYFNRARYLDATSCRFINEDPSQFFGGANFYRYSFNNPVNFTDPSGLAPSLLDRLLNWLKPTSPPPAPCPPKFNCDPDGYRDAAPDERARVLAQAAGFNGAPYAWGGKTPDGFDCSGFFCWVVQHSVNPNFPSQGTGTLGNSQPGLAPIAPGQAGPGDGVLLPGHVGFYNPNPSGLNLLSSRGSATDPNSKGVSPAPISGWPGTPIFLRLRVPCNQ